MTREEEVRIRNLSDKLYSMTREQMSLLTLQVALKMDDLIDVYEITTTLPRKKKKYHRKQILQLLSDYKVVALIIEGVYQTREKDGSFAGESRQISTDS